MADYKFDTLSLHAGQSPDGALAAGPSLFTKPPAMFLTAPNTQLLYLIWKLAGISIRA